MIARRSTPALHEAPLVILGGGYVGRAVYRQAAQRGLSAFVTSRAPDVRLAGLPEAARLAFDLERPSSWRNLPHPARVIWCFPPAPPEQVRAFARSALADRPPLVVLGSTSAYDLGRAGTPEPLLDETAPLAWSQPRVQGEEYLRKEHGAIVLRLAGLYGPGRHVLDWIRRGRVKASPRYVNLIHVEDAAAICLLALERASPGALYNVSDGTPRRWADICAEAHARWGIAPAPPDAETRPGKRLVIDKLKTDLGYEFRYPDLYAALAEIETEPRER